MDVVHARKMVDFLVYFEPPNLPCMDALRLDMVYNGTLSAQKMSQLLLSLRLTSKPKVLSTIESIILYLQWDRLTTILPEEDSKASSSSEEMEESDDTSSLMHVVELSVSESFFKG